MLEPDEWRTELTEAEANALARLVTTVARTHSAVVVWQIETPSYGEPPVEDVRALNLEACGEEFGYLPWYAVFVESPDRLATVLREAWPFVAPAVYPVASSAERKDVEARMDAWFTGPFDPGPVTARIREWVGSHGAYMETYGTDGGLDRILIAWDAADLSTKAMEAFAASGVRLRIGSA